MSFEIVERSLPVMNISNTPQPFRTGHSSDSGPVSQKVGRFNFMKRLFSIVATVSLMLLAPYMMGQDVSAGITGKITDPSAAPIPNATVSGEGRRSWHHLESADQRRRRLQLLPSPRRDSMRCGWKPAVSRRPFIRLRADVQPDGQDGCRTGDRPGLAKTLEVSGAAPLLQTQTTEVGTVMEAAPSPTCRSKRATTISWRCWSRAPSPSARLLSIPGRRRSTPPGRTLTATASRRTTTSSTAWITTNSSTTTCAFVAQRRCHPGIQRHHQQPGRGVRAFSRRRDQRQPEIRHEPVPRQRLRIPAQRFLQCERMVEQLQRIAHAAPALERVRRNVRRPRSRRTSCSSSRISRARASICRRRRARKTTFTAAERERQSLGPRHLAALSGDQRGDAVRPDQGRHLRLGPEDGRRPLHHGSQPNGAEDRLRACPSPNLPGTPGSNGAVANLNNMVQQLHARATRAISRCDWSPTDKDRFFARYSQQHITKPTVNSELSSIAAMAAISSRCSRRCSATPGRSARGW